MKVEQKRYTDLNKWENVSNESLNGDADLVIVFGSPSKLKNERYIKEIKIFYPESILIGCSTAGEIADVNVFDESLIVTAIKFDYTKIKKFYANVKDFDNDFLVGKFLADSFDKDKLKHIFILSDGLNVNGSDLVKGLVENLPQDVSITGGLSGDSGRFLETLVLSNEKAESNIVTALGFFGDRLKISYGSLGGWDSFGPERLITKSERNILYELDGKSALGLYKKYLGEHAEGLPATGLLFPLSLRMNNNEKPVVRTILSVEEDNQSMTFAGDVPIGSYAKLMKANFDRLIDGANGAALKCYNSMEYKTPDLAILISCVGRKMVLKQRTEEEIETVKEVLGKSTIITGFYSYGEISPFESDTKCELHNQTMTITCFLEI